jgi:hypothetical protein
MKKLSLILVISAVGTSAFSQFGPSNLIVRAVGDGDAVVAGNLPTSLQEFTTTGTFVSSVPLTNLSGRNLTMSYGETSEGGLRLSGDKKFIMLAGYDLTARDAGFDPFSSPRVVGKVNLNKQVTISPQFFPATGDGFREVYSDDGNNFFVTGGDLGVISGPFIGPATQILPILSSSRNITRFNGLIYFNGSDAFGGSNGMATFDDTTLVQTNLFASPGGGSGRDFHIVDANTIYYATSSGSVGLVKMVNIGGVWSEAYRLGGTGIGHIAVSGNTIYATASAGTSLRTTTDTGTGFAAWTTLATPAANTRFRGVEFAPIASASGLTGTANLQNWTASVAGLPVALELRQGSNLIQSTTKTLDSAGNFEWNVNLTGAYTLVVKGAHWLTNSKSVNLVNGTLVSTGSYSLVNGDVDGDNEVGPGDFEAVVSAFGLPVGDPSYIPGTDLDGDLEVGPSDFELVVSNFGIGGN